MEMRGKMKTSKTKATSSFYCYFCSRHILITFVGMTLLIVNYGVNPVKMSVLPYRNENRNKNNNITTSSSSSSISSSDILLSGSNLQLSPINGNKLDNKKSTYRNIHTQRSVKNNTNVKSHRIVSVLKIALPATPTSYDEHLIEEQSYYLNRSVVTVNRTEFELPPVGNFRKPRFFGLLGSNFSLSYNLTLNTGTSAGNITVVAPTPTYYYYVPAPAPAYPYYDPNSYYYPYSYNPYNPYNGYSQYTYNPYPSYSYYG